MVLGIQGLAELGLILGDFKNLKMEFMVDGRKFVLRGTTIGSKKLVSTNQIQKDLRHMFQASTIQIFIVQGNEENKVENEQHGNCPTHFQKMEHGKMLTRFNKSFQSFNLEDKASFDGGGNVTTPNKGSIGSLNL